MSRDHYQARRGGQAVKCTAKTSAGRPCRAPALSGSRPARCVAHATGKAAERQAEARREGGLQRMRQVDRRPPGPTPPQPGCKAEVDREIWRLCTRVEAGELAARDANVLLAGLRALRETVPDGASPDVQFFSLFSEVRVLDRGMVGVTSEGLRIPFTEAQVAAYRRVMESDSEPVEIQVYRGGERVGAGEGPEVVFEIDPPPEDSAEAEEGQQRGRRAMPETIIEVSRGSRSVGPVN